MFPGFREDSIDIGEVAIRAVSGGSGPALLLLHGYPQTHVIWRKVAPRLAERFTVVATDLRGYGDSSKPPGAADHSTYSKRRMALDQVEVMRALGHERFAVVGHDRGGRVAHRMAVDHPERITQARGARHRPDEGDVRADDDGVRARVLPLVLPDPARRRCRKR